MKLHSCLLIAALVLTTAGCQKKKNHSDEAGGDNGPAKPIAFHKSTECPDLTGTWQHDISIPAGPGTATDMKVEFGVDEKSVLTFKLIRDENEVWKVDGMTNVNKAGSKITAYCEAKAVVVEILSPENHYEALSFSADVRTGRLILLTDRTTGQLDHTTQGILLKEKTPKVFILTAPPESGRR